MRTHRGSGSGLFASCFAAALLASSGAAFAQTVAPVPNDVLQVNGGTALRGRVLELRLYQDATIQLEDGSIRVVPWSLIASGSVDVGTLQSASNWRYGVVTPAPLALPPPPPLSPLPATPRMALVDDLLEPGPGRVPVHVESDGTPQHIGLRSNHGFGEPPAILCTTPCTLYVAPGELPLVTLNDDRVHEHPVMVMANGARVLLHAGSTTRRAFGITMIPLGAVGILAGMMLSLGPTPIGFAGMDAGGILTVGGIAMIVGGVTLIRRAQPGVRSVSQMTFSGLGFDF